MPPKVFVHKQPPIVINRPPQSYTVNAGAPVVVKPAPVVIHRPGKNEIRPVVVDVTSRPIVVTKKVIKIERPVIKKVFVEQYSQKFDNQEDQIAGEYPSGTYGNGISQYSGISSYGSPIYPSTGIGATGIGATQIGAAGCGGCGLSSCSSCNSNPCSSCGATSPCGC